MTFVLGALLAALRLLPVAALAAPPADAVDFGAQARLLHRVAACGGDAALPAAFDARAVAAHCKAVARDVEGYRKKWLATALPVLARLVPAGIPDRVVYPFGGGDLLTALATFPAAVEYTTLSLEGIGDPRGIDTLDPKALRAGLDVNRKKVRRLLNEAYSTTNSLGISTNTDLPGPLVFTLFALAIHGYEPVALRYFAVEADGTLRYVTAADVAAYDQALPPRRAVRARKQGRIKAAEERAVEKERPMLTPAAEAGIFANMELTFRKAGAGDAAAHKTYRHIVANLDDEHLAASPGALEHLRKKGRVTAMTKAASFLLWLDSFATVRDYLLANMDWMISDTTGIPPSYARAAGFEQETWGRFERAYFAGGNGQAERELVALWKAQPRRDLPFRYGYPDGKKQPHLLITRRIVQNKK